MEKTLTEEMQSNEAKRKKKQKSKKIRKRVITIAVIALIVAAIVAAIVIISSKKGSETTDVLTDFVSRGSITSTVSGEGVAVAKDSASITLTSGGIVADVYVSEGDFVTAGTPLYKINSTTAEDAVEKASKTVSNYQKELNALYNKQNYLNIKTDFKGKLLNVESIEVGDTVTEGQKIATLVDDSKLLLTQYFNYTYEDDIYVGQPASVSIPSAMSQLSGTVESIHKVRRVSSEGSVLFEVNIVVDNPGSLSAEMSASAVLTSKSGESIYPYESGTFSYYKSTEILAKASGDVESCNLMNYAQVSAGQSLVRLSSDTIGADIAELENSLQTANLELKSATDDLAKLNAVSPIDGTILSLGITPGDEVASGTVAVNIANTQTMIINASIDERNISYVSSGMIVDLDQWGTYKTGLVESVSLNGQYENGVSKFPAVISLDNSDGAFMNGSYVTYTFTASQNDDCLIVPIQSVKYVETENGTGSVVFVKSDSKPDNAVTLISEASDIPKGFYPVEVETGISDTANIEIKSGVDEGVEIFTQIMKDTSSMW